MTEGGLIPREEHAAPPATAHEARALDAFAWLWAVAALFHHGHSPEWSTWARSPLALALSLMAFVVLIVPGSLPRFVALVALQTLTLGSEMPVRSNHSLFTFMVDVTILVTVLGVAARDPRRFDKVELWRRIAPLVRAELLILYFWVVFHKLNHDFLDPTLSCGSSHYVALRREMTFLPSPRVMGVLPIWATLAIEALIPILLVPLRTRRLGLAVGGIFHFILGVNGFFDFSSMMLALYAFFVPPAAWADLAERAGRARAWVGSRLGSMPWSGDSAPGLLAVLGACTATILLGYARLPAEQIWWVFGLLSFGLLAAISRRELWDDCPRVSPPFRGVYALSWMMPVLLFLNGASPYLGLKTETAFAMFSNLRTEGGQSNHLFVPSSWQMWSYQRDLVSPLGSSRRNLARRRHRMPFVMYRQLVAEEARSGRGSFSVAFIRAGRRQHIDDVRRVRELVTPLPWYQKSFFRFQRIGVRGCRH